jgi:hypothetical protein
MAWQIREMSHEDYQLALYSLGLNIAQGGRFLGVSTTTSQRYYSGRAKVPVAEALLLRAMIEFKQAPKVPPYQGIKAKRRREQAAMEHV